MARPRSRSNPDIQAPPEDDLDLVSHGANVGFLVRKTHRAFARRLSEHLAPYDVSAAQWTILRALWQADQCSQVDLAAQIAVEKASLTSLLLSLEEQGLIERKRSIDDRRRWLVCLTPKGRKMEKTLLPIAAKIEQMALMGFSEHDVQAFRAMLAKSLLNLS